jgi:hypothetical protein
MQRSGGPVWKSSLRYLRGLSGGRNLSVLAFGRCSLLDIMDISINYAIELLTRPQFTV